MLVVLHSRIQLRKGAVAPFYKIFMLVVFGKHRSYAMV